MGNTIRREPVNFDIPDSPDYKFLNITDFRGIAISDNPFTLSSNTASDMLNLYVDETNTLTTRPRLERFVSLKKDHPNLTKFLGWYPLSFGFLVHYIESVNSYAMDIAIEVNGELTYYEVNNGGTIKGKKLTVFEQNDNIYILDGNNYYVITYTLENNVLSDTTCSLVEGYIPTVSVGGTNLADGREYEPYNILSNKYKKSYFWDGTWNIYSVSTDNNDELDFSKLINDSHFMDYSNYIPIQYIPNEEESSGKYFWSGQRLFVKSQSRYYANSTEIGWIDMVKNGDELTLSSFSPVDFPSAITSSTDYNDAIMKVKLTADGSRKAILLSTGMYDDSSGICVVDSPEGEETVLKTGLKVYRDSTFESLALSDDGLIVAYITDYGHERGTGSFAVSYWDSSTKTWITQEWDLEGRRVRDLKMSRDGSTLLVAARSSDNMAEIYFLTGLTPSEKITPIKAQIPINIYYLVNGTLRDTDLSYDGSMWALPKGVCRNIKNNDFTVTPYSSISIHNACVRFSLEGNKIYILQRYSSSFYSGWYDIETETMYSFPIHYRGRILYVTTYVTDSKVLMIDNDDGSFLLDSYYFDYSSEEPNVTITYSITSDNDIYDDFIQRNNLFNESLLTIRFDNQRWFGVKNVLFRTADNNPNYIPFTSYSSLGETDENITGFNLVQDDLLVVYKDNYIWAVSPMTYTQNNMTYYDYNYQETKNTVGNNAIGASIVSAYSELPLQITYDGIYALSQLSNVYASDRISESISDNIAKKWQKEEKNIIQTAQTLNRLYWTYVILSYEKITKVYLLDNRTASWFYWELPISVVNAFVKDNIVYLSDIDGIIYTLRTSDIINKYNPNTTEYYDDGEQIITWFWKSQILPLGTINYSKRLIDTTFIFTDTDSTDEYSLDYTFTAYRKVVSKTNATTLSNQLNYIQSTTKKTLINRCNFIQLELSNTVDDLNNNKLRLVGLGFKYVLLEGLL